MDSHGSEFSKPYW